MNRVTVVATYDKYIRSAVSKERADLGGESRGAAAATIIATPWILHRRPTHHSSRTTPPTSPLCNTHL